MEARHHHQLCSRKSDSGWSSHPSECSRPETRCAAISSKEFAAAIFSRTGERLRNDRATRDQTRAEPTAKARILSPPERDFCDGVGGSVCVVRGDWRNFHRPQQFGSSKNRPAERCGLAAAELDGGSAACVLPHSAGQRAFAVCVVSRSEEHTSELQ